MATPQQKLLFTAEEYLALERQADERHEYIDGHIRAMAGESLEHGYISNNLVRELGLALKGKPCAALSKDMKVRSGPEPKPKTRIPKDFFSYPDLVIFCGEPAFHDKFRDVLLTPKAIIEVLSASTEAFDRGEKFIRYRTYNDTLTDYILVAQNKPYIEHFTRQSNGTWLMSPVDDLEKSFYIASIDCQLRLTEIYDRVIFPVAEPDETLEPNEGTDNTDANFR